MRTEEAGKVEAILPDQHLVESNKLMYVMRETRRISKIMNDLLFVLEGKTERDSVPISQTESTVIVASIQKCLNTQESFAAMTKIHLPECNIMGVR
jgi:hypothetical protein